VAGLASVIQKIVPPRVKAPIKGVARTKTFDPSAAQRGDTLSLPTYRDHLTDIFSNRTANDSRTLILDLLKFDPDFSAALHAYLTVANTQPIFEVYDTNDEPDRAGQQMLQQILVAMMNRTDYSDGFRMLLTLDVIAEAMRYMILARGAIASELVVDKTFIPREVRTVDFAELEWVEKQSGQYKPVQVTSKNEEIDLDIPTFFVRYYRQNPTEIYPQSIFVSAINTVAARQQVMNDLYRIMNLTGYPRIEAKVLEEVLRKNAPAGIKDDEEQMRSWMRARLDEIAAQVANMRPDTVWVHYDSVESKILNEKGSNASLDVSGIIGILNSINQSALKTMATVIGRGTGSGVNTATVEARIFTMMADEINKPIADIFSAMFTLALRLQGSQSYVHCYFEKAEMRPLTELEAQYAIKQARYLELLSHGVITDDEFHLQMFGRFRPDSAPELSGTGFYEGSAQVDTGDVTPNGDPLGRSVSPEGKRPTRDNKNKSPSKPALSQLREEIISAFPAPTQPIDYSAQISAGFTSLADVLRASPPPVVNVEVKSPDVNITPAPINIDVAAPVLPAAAPINIDVQAHIPRRGAVEKTVTAYDADGRIVSMMEKEIEPNE